MWCSEVEIAVRAFSCVVVGAAVVVQVLDGSSSLTPGNTTR